MFHHVRKEDIATVLDELGEPVDEDCKLVELKNKLLNTKEYLEDPEFVKTFLTDVIEKRREEEKKREEEKRLERENEKLRLEMEKERLKMEQESERLKMEQESERLKMEQESEKLKMEQESERLKMENEKLKIEKESEKLQIEKEQERIRLEHELELARIAATKNDGGRSPSPMTHNDSENDLSLDKLIKGVETLTIPVPRRTESWNLFFESIERAFKHKNVPTDFKAEILLKLLGDKASNVLTYIEEQDLKDYEKVKKLILKEFEPSPQVCLENFRKASRKSGETHIQLASRLTAMWEYYCKLRRVDDLKSIKELIVSDKIFQLLDRETASHIAVRQGEDWLKPQDLARECDVYFGAQRKSFEEPLYDNKQIRDNSAMKTPDRYIPPQRRREESKIDNNYVRGRSCFFCGNNSHLIKDCPEKKNRGEGYDKSRDQSTWKNSINSRRPDYKDEDEVLVARVTRIQCQAGANQEMAKPVTKIKIFIDSTELEAAVDSGSEISTINSSYISDLESKGKGRIKLLPAFGQTMEANLCKIPVYYKNCEDNMFNLVEVLMAVTDKLNEPCLLTPHDYELLINPSKEKILQPHEEKNYENGSELCLYSDVSYDQEEKSSSPTPTTPTRERESVSNLEPGACHINETEKLQKEQMECPTLKQTVEMGKEGKGCYSFINNLLYHQEKIEGLIIKQLVLPKGRRDEVLQVAHKSAVGCHLDMRKTKGNIRKSFFWPGLSNDVEQYCKVCEECRLRRTKKKADKGTDCPVGPAELTFPPIPNTKKKKKAPENLKDWTETHKKASLELSKN